MIAALSGLVAGLFHVLSGPDHLAAVAPLSMDGKTPAWGVGMRWGIGHCSGVVLVGALSLVFRNVLPIDLWSSWAERLVGVVLVGLGIWGIRRGLTQHVHIHRHSHGGRAHVHIHVHAPGEQGTAAERPHRHTHAAFAVGTLHGLAGSSHFLGVLPALAFSQTTHALAYLLAYGVGTIAAMTGFTGTVGWLSRVSAHGGPGVYRACLLGSSATALVVGAWWLLLN